MPCVVTHRSPCDPSHIRYGLEGGTGLKPSDDLVVPLSPELHRRSHRIGEVIFWQNVMRENPTFMMICLKAFARQLYRDHHKQETQ